MLFKYFYNHLSFFRRLSQIMALIFIFAVPWLNRNGFHQILGTYYSMSIGPIDIVDPALLIQSILLTKQFYITLIFAAILPVLIALVFGRVFCSWACPFNFFVELIEKIGFFARKRIKKNVNPKPLYYWISPLVFLLFILIFNTPIITFFSMPGLISSQVGQAIFFGSIGFELTFVLIIIGLEIIIARKFWCKYICPVGAILALCRTRRTLTVQFTPQKCIRSSQNPPPCQSACPLHLNPRSKGIHPYCYNCGKCISACQKHGNALNFSFQNKKQINLKEIINR